MVGDFINVQVSVDGACRILPRILRRAVRVPNGCLEYQLSPSARYPMISVGGIPYKVSRVVLTAKLGRVLLGNALHSCDNPRCVDAEHLSEGSQVQNVGDARMRGRGVGRAPIDPLLVKRILEPGLTAREAAFVTGVSMVTVYAYRNRAKLEASLSALPVLPLASDHE